MEVKFTQFELNLNLVFVLLCTKIVRIRKIFLQILSVKHLLYVVALNDPWSLKLRSRSLGLNLVFDLPWWSCVPNLVRIRQRFFRYWAETIFHMLSTWMTFVILKLRSRSHGSKIIFVLPWCFCVPNLVKIRQIFLEILSGNHLAYAHPPAQCDNGCMIIIIINNNTHTYIIKLAVYYWNLYKCHSNRISTYLLL